MNSFDTIKLALKKEGNRITLVREEMIRLFIDTSVPVTAQYILDIIGKKKHSINKTTVYRELAFLKEKNIIKSLQLLPGQLHYEFLGKNHHHHLVCKLCGDIKNINCDNFAMEREPFKNEIRKVGFTVNEHSLDFYGTCIKCS